MEQSVKREIAKEIIILLSSVIFILVGVAIVWVVREININRKEYWKKEIVSLKLRIDSVELSYPKTNSFYSMFTTGLFSRVRYESQRSLDELYQDESWPDEPTTTNLKRLYKTLEQSGYPFNGVSFNDFKKEIVEELKIDRKPNLSTYFSFLREKINGNITFDEFISTIKGLPFPMPETTLERLTRTTRYRVEQLKLDVIGISRRIYSSSQMMDIAQWLGFITLTIVYPIRGVIISVIWAVRTLKR